MRRTIHGIWSLLLVLAIPAWGHAVSPGGKLIVSLNPGIGFFALHDINRLIDDNQSGFMTVTPAQGLSRMSWGLDLGSSVFYGATDYLLLGVDFSYLVTDTSAKVGDGVFYPPQDDYYKISLPAVEISAMAKAAWHASSLVLLSAGLGVSSLSLVDAGERLESRGTLTGTVYSTAIVPYSGSTLGFKFVGGVDLMIWEWFSLGLEGGYRLARFDEIKARLNDRTVTLQNADGSNFTLDYSGLFLRYTFRFYF